ncbi:glycosyltransferase family 2 protein [Bacteroides oleiciplenus]|uniref:Glycosyltransferase 2-like domain-containing protein n=1 Tax=Bacteroides oleiciplenus YIT 12058 TaxID=742727 RepID=K9E206_9BACE|nr:glycosyltransferase family 2 protein [Bacteroides oleiciplenus]EKU90743.1 hypothetical protein HMPREF9447_02161 [Bacteroides oleiciplenus YIT 12058]
MKTPILSIITVNFNNNEGLKKTLRSIETQSYTSYEHIIIDADSNDGSKETIEKYSERNTRLTYWVSEKDNGIYDGMNKGIRQAKGEYLYFLNSGDCLQGDILKKISFDGTKYIYGDMVLINNQEQRKETGPDYPDLIFFFYNALAHQACFIHHSLFADKLYDTRYKIIADWGHSFQSIIMEGCSYRHIPSTIAECDGTGISSNYIDVQTERLKWLKENLSHQLYSTYIDILEYNKSEFKAIIPTMNHTKKFQKRARKLVCWLLKLNAIFSSHHTPAEDIYNSILYRPFSNK